MARVPGAATRPRESARTLSPSTAVEGDFVIGVIDTGVNVAAGRPHPFLAPNLAKSWPDNVDQATVDVLDGHGTFVAGQIVRHAPAATLDVRNTLDGTSASSDDLVAAAIRSLAQESALRLVNLSFFSDEDRGVAPAGIQAALDELFAAHPNVLVVAAAGNHWTDAPTFPGAFSRQFPGLISVGAADESVVRGNFDAAPPRASFSNYGPWVSCYAGGVNLLGPRSVTEGDGGSVEGGWALWSGTSFAAATVTGLLAAEMLSGERLSAAAARAKLLDGRPTVEGRPFVSVDNEGVNPELENWT